MTLTLLNLPYDRAQKARREFKEIYRELRRLVRRNQVAEVTQLARSGRIEKALSGTGIRFLADTKLERKTLPEPSAMSAAATRLLEPNVRIFSPQFAQFYSRDEVFLLMPCRYTVLLNGNRYELEHLPAQIRGAKAFERFRGEGLLNTLGYGLALLELRFQRGGYLPDFGPFNSIQARNAMVSN